VAGWTIGASGLAEILAIGRRLGLAEGAGTWPKYAGKPVSWSTPKPSAAAASASAPPVILERSEMKAVLHELATACFNVISPSRLLG